MSILKNIVPLVKSVTDLDVSPEIVTDDELILKFHNSTYTAEFYHGMVDAAAHQLKIPIKDFNIEKKYGLVCGRF